MGWLLQHIGILFYHLKPMFSKQNDNMLQMAKGEENHRREGVGSRQKGEKHVGSGGILPAWDICPNGKYFLTCRLYKENVL